MESDIDDDVWEAIRKGDIDRLKALSRIIEGFPCGLANSLIGTRWLNYAVEVGNLDSIIWMLEKGAPIDFEDGPGYTVLHTAIDSYSPEKYIIMRKLIECGANVDLPGFNNWTPAHLAAVRNDVEALQILKDSGADFTARTRIDNYATPLEEALRRGESPAAVAFLQKALSNAKKETGNR